MIPQIGLAGKYEVNPPFALNANEAYVCRGISFIQSLIDKNVDVYGEYYQPAVLTQAEYEEDLETEEAIITLKSNSGNVVNLPSSYIKVVPQDKEVKYHRFGALIELGLLPEDEPFDTLIDSIKEEVKIRIGVEPSVGLAKLPYDGFVTVEEDAQLRLDREVNIQHVDSPLLTVQRQAEEIARLKQRILELEDVVRRLSN